MAILILFGPGLKHLLTISFSADRANDDALQVTWPLFRFSYPPLFTTDPIADYYVQNQMPLGYHILMRGLASTFDPVPLSTTIGHLSFITALVFAFLIGRSVAGAVGAWICVAFILASDALLEQTAGGLPRAVGFVLAFVAMYGFLCDRRGYTACASVLGALFWYPIAVGAGVLYATQCLAPRDFFAWKDDNRFTKRAVMVLLVGSLTLGFSAPKIISGLQWGPIIPNVSLAWPEAGTRGRLDPENQLGLGRPTQTVLWALQSGFRNHNAPWLARSDSLAGLQTLLSRIVSLMLLLGLAVLARAHPIARRLLAVVAISITLYVAAIVVAPLLYAPSRFVMVFIPGVSVFAFLYLGSIGAIWLSKQRSWADRRFVLFFAGAFLILLLGGRPFEQGYEMIRIDMPQKRALDFISKLPTNALIAGWPKEKNIIDKVPLFSRRRVLLSYETHMPFHEGYLRDMRAKAKAIIDVWFAVDAEPLRSLSERYGVTHFVIEKALRENRSLSYFRPFDQYIIEKRKELDGKKRWIETPPRETVAFEDESLLIIDLAKLWPAHRSVDN
jgi:hypothetical protein